MSEILSNNTVIALISTVGLTVGVGLLVVVYRKRKNKQNYATPPETQQPQVIVPMDRSAISLSGAVEKLLLESIGNSEATITMTVERTATGESRITSLNATLTKNGEEPQKKTIPENLVDPEKKEKQLRRRA